MSLSTVPSLPADYTALMPLGQGAFGTVWRASHRTWGDVAVKVLSAGADAEATWRFGAEHRTLAALTVPGVPRALGTGLTADGLPYLTMSLMPGDSPAGPWPVNRARRVITALAEVLAGLHAAGWVHGDVKAENVLVTPEDAVALVDLATLAATGSARDGVTGTRSHLAPEALRGAPWGEAADLFALGVTAFGLWTGALPPDAVARLQGAELPGLPDGDAAFATAVTALLALDPAERAAGLWALGVAAPRCEGLRPVDLPLPAAQLTAWREVLATGGGLAAVGPAGSGRTRLLDAWRGAAVEAGRKWVGVTATGSTPYATARAIVRRLVAGTLAGVSPETQAWLAGGWPAAWEALEPRSRRAALAAAVTADLVRASTPVTGVALAVDDWHEADEASRTLLLNLQGSPALGGIAWAFGASEPLAGVPGVVLTPWPAADLLALAEARLGSDVPAALRPILTGFVWPGELNRALARWTATGALDRPDGAWRFDPARAAGTAPPPTAPGLAAMIALAWPAGGLPLAALADHGAPDWQADLDALTRTGWATVRGGLIRPSDAAAAGPALAPLSPAERTSAATLLAITIAAVGAPAIAARLALVGDDPALAATLVLQAAAIALDALAGTEADALLQAAPEPTNAAEKLGLAWLRGEAARLADRADAAVAAYDTAITLADAAENCILAAQARIGRAKAHQLRGRYAPATADAKQAEADVAERAPLIAARAAVTGARLALFSGDPVAASQACARAEALARASNDPAAGVVLAAALNLHGALIAEADPGQGAEARAKLDEALALTLAAGDRLGHAAALESLGNVHLATGDLPAARDAFAAHEAACRAAQAPTERLSGAMNHALALAALGDPAAATLALAVAEEAESRGRPFVAALSRAAEGEAACRLGDWARVWPALDAALAHATGAQNLYAETLVRLSRLEAAATMALPDRLTAELDAFQPDAAAAEAQAGATLGRAALALLAGGAAREAETLLAAFTDHPNRAVARRALMLGGEAALQANDPDTAAGRFAAALAIATAWRARHHQEAAWLGLARAGGPARAESWLALLLDPTAAAIGHPIARAEAAAHRLAAGRAPGAAGQRALDTCRRALAARDPGAPPLRGLAAAAKGSAAATLSTTSVTAWLGAIGLAPTPAAVHDTLLMALLDLAQMQRGYLLAYHDGQLVDVATRQLSFAHEVAEGFSTTIADEAMISGEPVYVVDATSGGRFTSVASVVALGLRSVLAVPVATATTILGVAYADRADLDPILGPHDLALLHAIATMAAERIAALRDAERFRAWADGTATLSQRLRVADDRRAVLLAGLVALSGAAEGRWGPAEAHSGGRWTDVFGLDAERSLALAALEPAEKPHVAACLLALSPWLEPLAHA